MKLIHTVVSVVGFENKFGNTTFNQERMRLLQRLAEIASEEGAKLLVIPAGFLAVDSDKEVQRKVRDVESLSQSKGIAIIGGVDVKNGRPKVGKEDMSSPLPYWGFAVGSEAIIQESSNHLWRQTSMRSDDWKGKNVPGSERVIKVGDYKVAVLICGEIYSPKAREAMTHECPRLIVDIGHVSVTRIKRTMTKFAKQAKCPVAHSQHLRHLKGRHIQFVDACGRDMSQPASDHLVNDCLPQAAWAARLIDLSP